MKKILLTTVIVFVSLIGFAHPGHGTFNGHEPSHYFTSPSHIILVIAAALAGVYFLIKKKSKQTR